jgi:hypothetical protein
MRPRPRDVRRHEQETDSMNAVTPRMTGELVTTASPIWRPRALAIGAATVVNLAILVVGRVASGDYPVAETAGGGEMTIGPGTVIGATLALGLLAWGLLALLERRTDRHRAARIWTGIALSVLAFSLLGPLGGVDGASKLTLTCLHLAGGMTIIPRIRRSAMVD